MVLCCVLLMPVVPSLPRFYVVFFFLGFSLHCRGFYDLLDYISYCGRILRYEQHHFYNIEQRKIVLYTVARQG